MKRLATCAGVAGLAAGQAFNGHGTETIGAYLMVFAGCWLLIASLGLLLHTARSGQ